MLASSVFLLVSLLSRPPILLCAEGSCRWLITSRRPSYHLVSVCFFFPLEMLGSSAHSEPAEISENEVMK